MNMNKVDVAIIGAGFGGIYGVYKLHKLGFSVVCFDTAPSVGGTWYWNAYPNARCDVESMLYSYSFDDSIQQEWHWTHRYAYQPEIIRYLNFVADKLNVRPHIRLNCSVTGAKWDDSHHFWKITTSTGEEYLATYVISATGCLSHPIDPHFDGVDKFKGTLIRSGKWPENVKAEQFAGKNVAIVGTGSSGVQIIPLVANYANQFYVVQRTPRYVVPIRQRNLSDEEENAIKSDYKGFRERNFNTPSGFLTPKSKFIAKAEPEEDFEKHMEELYKNDGGIFFITAYLDIVIDRDSNRRVGDFYRKKIRETVKDPKVAEALCPSRDLFIISQRTSMEDNYYETYNRPNVKLLPVPNSTISFDEHHLLIDNDQKFPVDVVILATGFQSMLGSMVKINFEGVNGVKLSEKWANVSENYLGLSVPQFPNLFMVSGPGSPSILTAMVPTIEQHINFFADTLEFMRSKKYDRIEATQANADGWVQFTSAVMDPMVFRTVKSNYTTNLKGEIGYVMALFGLDHYTKKLQEVKDKEWSDFILS